MCLRRGGICALLACPLSWDASPEWCLSRPHAEAHGVCAAPRAGLPRPLPTVGLPFSPSPCLWSSQPSLSPCTRARGTCLVHPSLESCDNFAAFGFLFLLYSAHVGKEGRFVCRFSPPALATLSCGTPACGKALGLLPSSLILQKLGVRGAGSRLGLGDCCCWAPASWGKGAP